VVTGTFSSRAIRAASRHTPVQCLNLNDQVAQKLHACTGPFSTGRARDVLDILLIELFGRLEMAAVREASIRLFAERATHDFPRTSEFRPNGDPNWKDWPRISVTERLRRQRSKPDFALLSMRWQVAERRQAECYLHATVIPLCWDTVKLYSLRFVHDQVKRTGRNWVFQLSHRLAAAWSRIWSKRAPILRLPASLGQKSYNWVIPT
jgi:hypothetical protein